MPTLKLYLYVCLIMLVGMPWRGLAQEIACDNSVYLTTYSASGSNLYRMQVTEEKGIHNLEEIFVDNLLYRIGCIGYSVVDKMIYGLEFNTHELLRINAFGEITSLGVPAGLDTSLEYYAGDVFPNGRALFVIGRDKDTQLDTGYYEIDIFELQASPLEFEGSGNKVIIQDMAINPRDGAVFAYDNQQNKIVNIDFGIVSNFLFPALAEEFTALFFDESFNLYGYGERGGMISQKFYAINKTNSEVTFLRDGPLAIDSDACACPYRMDFLKKMTPNNAIPCQEVTIEYSFVNQSGMARTGLSIIDTLPDVLTITDIDLGNAFNKFDAAINSGVGSHILNLSNLQILVADVHIITVTAVVNVDAKGTYESQGVLKNLPLALNPTIISDDLLTNDVDDPNTFSIIDADDTGFRDSISYSCDNESAIIYAAIPDANAFLWGNESTDATLEVTESGLYTVVMETDCLTYTDTIAVNFDRMIPFVDLGADLLQVLGEPFALPFEAHTEAIVQYHWQAALGATFSCIDCASPAISVTEPTTISLTITDTEGCQLIDEIFVEVINAKNIYAPTVFSPNGDGINDIFFLQGVNAKILVFQIFDRWGNLVFDQRNAEVNQLSDGWDGRHQGAFLDSGVFIWSAQLAFLDGTMDNLTGQVTNIRQK
ncbi:MAG: gliding motility-associated C-terminal domain-containing protein [Saprospiraceae bacterium]